MNLNIILIIAGILVVLFVGYEIWIHMMKNKQLKGNVYHLTINLDQLLQSLKGKENIISATATNSKIRFELKDTEIDVDAIKQLGASGIVASNNSVTIIFGKQSQAICDAINNK